MYVSYMYVATVHNEFSLFVDQLLTWPIITTNIHNFCDYQNQCFFFFFIISSDYRQDKQISKCVALALMQDAICSVSCK